MTKPGIEEFAKLLTQAVRDRTLQSCDERLRSTSASRAAVRWQKAISTSSCSTFAEVAIPDIIDDTIFYLLTSIDQGILNLSYSASSGKTVALSVDGLGELAGWYMGSGGWRESYSKGRVADDFSISSDVRRVALWMIQDGGGDVVAMCDLCGTDVRARVV